MSFSGELSYEKGISGTVSLAKTDGPNFETELIRCQKFTGGKVHYRHLIEVLGFYLDNSFPIFANLQFKRDVRITKQIYE